MVCVKIEHIYIPTNGVMVASPYTLANDKYCIFFLIIKVSLITNGIKYVYELSDFIFCLVYFSEFY